jgi:hypothetical protein
LTLSLKIGIIVYKQLEEIKMRIKRIWYDVTNDYTLVARKDSPSDLLEMEYSTRVKELDGIIFGYDIHEGCVYFLGPVGMEDESLEEYDLNGEW